MTQLGKYELHELIGKGGFGIVYRATDTTLDRMVALKILHPQLLLGDGNFLARFHQEARLAAGLDSPRIVTVYEVDEAEGQYFIAMRYYPGGNLAERLQRGPLDWEAAAEVLEQVCQGVQKLHEQGWIHRDLKPANILFDGEGGAVVSDFGLTRSLSASTSSASGTGAGTPYYRAPELWNGKPPASPATDVYSLGCILGEMLTGRAVFPGNTPVEVLTRHVLGRPDLEEGFPPKGSPAGIVQLIETVLAVDSSRRPQDARALATALSVLDKETHQRTEKERLEAEKANLRAELEIQIRAEQEQKERERKTQAEEAERLRLHMEETARAEDAERDKREAKADNLALEQVRLEGENKFRDEAEALATQKARLATEEKEQVRTEAERGKQTSTTAPTRHIWRVKWRQILAGFLILGFIGFIGYLWLFLSYDDRYHAHQTQTASVLHEKSQTETAQVGVRNAIAQIMTPVPSVKPADINPGDPVQTLVYSEDFSSFGLFNLNSTFGDIQLLQDEGQSNQVLQLLSERPDVSPSAGFGPSDFRDGSVKFRFRVNRASTNQSTSGVVTFFFRIQGPWLEDGYALKFQPGNPLVELGYLRPGGLKWTSLYKEAFPVGMGQWYLAQVEMSGARIQVRIDGKPLFDYTDSAQTSNKGRMALQGGPNSTIWIDDIKVFVAR